MWLFFKVRRVFATPFSLLVNPYDIGVIPLNAALTQTTCWLRLFTLKECLPHIWIPIWLPNRNKQDLDSVFTILNRSPLSNVLTTYGVRQRSTGYLGLSRIIMNHAILFDGFGREKHLLGTEKTDFRRRTLRQQLERASLPQSYCIKLFEIHTFD